MPSRALWKGALTLLTPDEAATLLGSFLFKGVDSALAAPHLEGLASVPFEKGAEVYSAHNFRRSIGLVLKGELAVCKGEVVLNTLGVGDCFGVAALFHPTQSYVSTITAQRRSQVVFLSDQALLKLFAAAPGTAVNYISFLSERITFLNQKIDAFTAPSAEAGLALYLLHSGQDGVVLLPKGYSQLARQLGVGRASLYRSLDTLERAGAIARGEQPPGQKVITIRSEETLRTLSGR